MIVLLAKLTRSEDMYDIVEACCSGRCSMMF